MTPFDPPLPGLPDPDPPHFPRSRGSAAPPCQKPLHCLFAHSSRGSSPPRWTDACPPRSNMRPPHAPLFPAAAAADRLFPTPGRWPPVLFSVACQVPTPPPAPPFPRAPPSLGHAVCPFDCDFRLQGMPPVLACPRAAALRRRPPPGAGAPQPKPPLPLSCESFLWGRLHGTLRRCSASAATTASSTLNCTHPPPLPTCPLA